MEQLAKLLTEQLVKKGADYQKRDIYQYALEYFLSTIIGMLGIITITILFCSIYFFSFSFYYTATSFGSFLKKSVTG